MFEPLYHYCRGRGGHGRSRATVMRRRSFVARRKGLGRCEDKEDYLNARGGGVTNHISGGGCGEWPDERLSSSWQPSLIR